MPYTYKQAPLPEDTAKVQISVGQEKCPQKGVYGVDPDFVQECRLCTLVGARGIVGRFHFLTEPYIRLVLELQSTKPSFGIETPIFTLLLAETVRSSLLGGWVLLRDYNQRAYRTERKKVNPV